MANSFCNLPLLSLSGRLTSALGICLLWCALAQPQEAHAKKPAGHKATASQTKHAKGAVKVKGTATRSPSEESRAERERRLFRECRGMHDAGACKGFTRGRN
ncbi:MAG: hypothetical protein ACTS5I_02665 [Rhodanobacter sp.]